MQTLTAGVFESAGCDTIGIFIQARSDAGTIETVKQIILSIAAMQVKRVSVPLATNGLAATQ